jgi:hypothetical protein
LYGICHHTSQLFLLFFVYLCLLYPDRQRLQHLRLDAHVLDGCDRRPIFSVLRCEQGV